MKEKVVKTEEEWRQQLTPEQYRVARQKGTERPFTGQYYRNKDAGKHSRVLDCRGFSVVVRIDRGGPSTLSIVDTAAAQQDSGATATPAKEEPAPAKPKPRKGRGGKGKTG